MKNRPHPERRWATGVLVVSGLISLSFNTRHAFYATTLPAPLALGYGAGPVVLAAAQSHVVALQASRGDLVGGWRKAATFGLVIGALALSFLGIYDLLRVAVPDPIPGTPFNEPAILTPIVVDLMAIAALHELLRPAAVAADLADPNPVRVPELVFETHPVTGQQTRSADRSETVTATGSGPRSETPAPSRSETRSEDRSGVQVPDQAVARSADRSDLKVSDSPAEKVPDPGKPKPRTRKRTRAKPKPLDRIDEARAADETYLAEHGRHIPAEKLASALRIGKPAALELVKQVRGAHMDIAK